MLNNTKIWNFFIFNLQLQGGCSGLLTRMSERQLRSHVRDSRRRRVRLDVDLNTPPPDETSAGHSAAAAAGLQELQQVDQRVTNTQAALPAAIDVEAIDDEVVISSPRSFAEARNKSRRNHGVTLVLDDDAEGRGTSVEWASRLAHNNNKKRRRAPTNQAPSRGLCINLECSDNAKRTKAVKPSEPSQSVPPPPPPPKEPIFSCPVCMCQLLEETSTKCGHIFCKKCIKATINAQNKCPTCRRKITMKDTFRVYLPTVG